MIIGRRAALFGAMSAAACQRAYAGQPAYLAPQSAIERLLYAVTLLYHDQAVLQATGQMAIRRTAGTGFFLTLPVGTASRTLLVTNKHVALAGGGELNGFIHTASSARGRPDGAARFRLAGSLGDGWIGHPEENVDLCAFVIDDVLKRVPGNPYLCPLTEDMIITDDEVADLSQVEDVLMVGCPAGEYDKTYLYPLMFRGTTASNPRLDYNGGAIICVDIAVTGGASGSPVFLYRPGDSFTDRHGVRHASDPNRLRLLGVMHAEFGVATSIGYAVKARELRHLAEEVGRRLGG